MSFLKKLFGGNPEPADPEKVWQDALTAPLPVPPIPASGIESEPTDPYAEPDPGFGHPLAYQACCYARMKDWESLSRFYRSKKLDDATLILNAVTWCNDYSDALEFWGDENPEDGYAQLFSGSNLSWRAWEARGGRLAIETSEGSIDLFHTWLAEARERLIKAQMLFPKDPEPPYRLLKVNLGLGERALADYLLEEVKKNHPEHLSAHMDMLTIYTQKWGGSHELMFNFAESVTENAKPGSPLHALAAMASIERSVHYMIQDDYTGANTFLQGRENQQSIYAAYQRSVAYKGFKETTMSPLVYNWFACAGIYSQLDLGKESLEKMGGAVTSRPWAYIRMPVIGHVNEMRQDYDLQPI